MVVTMVEAQVAEEQQETLLGEYRGLGDLPPFILETFLLRDTDSDLWRITTVWESAEALAEYVESVETPEALRIFRAAGAEPSLTVFEVAHRLTHSS